MCRTLKHFRDDAKNMETLKELIMKNGDDKSKIFYLKVGFLMDGN